MYKNQGLGDREAARPADAWRSLREEPRQAGNQVQAAASCASGTEEPWGGQQSWALLRVVRPALQSLWPQPHGGPARWGSVPPGARRPELLLQVRL